MEPIVRRHDAAVAEAEELVPESVPETQEDGSQSNPISLDAPIIPSRRPTRKHEDSESPAPSFMPTPVTEATFNEPSFSSKRPIKGMTTAEAAAQEAQQEADEEAEREAKAALSPAKIPSRRPVRSAPTPEEHNHHGMTTAEAAKLEAQEEADLKEESKPFVVAPTIPSRPSRPSSRPARSSEPQSETPMPSAALQEKLKEAAAEDSTLRERIAQQDAEKERVHKDSDLGLAVGLGPMDRPIPAGIPKDDMALLHESLSEAAENPEIARTGPPIRRPVPKDDIALMQEGLGDDAEAPGQGLAAADESTSPRFDTAEAVLREKERLAKTKEDQTPVKKVQPTEADEDEEVLPSKHVPLDALELKHQEDARSAMDLADEDDEEEVPLPDRVPLDDVALKDGSNVKAAMAPGDDTSGPKIPERPARPSRPDARARKEVSEPADAASDAATDAATAADDCSDLNVSVPTIDSGNADAAKDAGEKSILGKVVDAVTGGAKEDTKSTEPREAAADDAATSAESVQLPSARDATLDLSKDTPVPLGTTEEDAIEEPASEKPKVGVSEALGDLRGEIEERQERTAEKASGSPVTQPLVPARPKPLSRAGSGFSDKSPLIPPRPMKRPDKNASSSSLGTSNLSTDNLSLEKDVKDIKEESEPVAPKKKAPPPAVKPKPKIGAAFQAALEEKDKEYKPKPRVPVRSNKISALAKGLDGMFGQQGGPMVFGAPMPKKEEPEEEVTEAGGVPEEKKDKEIKSDSRRGRVKGPKRKLPTAAVSPWKESVVADSWELSPQKRKPAKQEPVEDSDDDFEDAREHVQHDDPGHHSKHAVHDREPKAEKPADVEVPAQETTTKSVHKAESGSFEKDVLAADAADAAEAVKAPHASSYRPKRDDAISHTHTHVAPEGNPDDALYKEDVEKFATPDHPVYSAFEPDVIKAATHHHPYETGAVSEPDVIKSATHHMDPQPFSPAIDVDTSMSVKTEDIGSPSSVYSTTTPADDRKQSVGSIIGGYLDTPVEPTSSDRIGETIDETIAEKAEED